MTARHAIAASLFLSLTACGGASVSPVAGGGVQSAQAIARSPAAKTIIAWTPKAITLHGATPRYATLAFTASDTYNETNLCGTAVSQQRVAEVTRGNTTYFTFEIISHSPPTTCTITATIAGTGQQPSSTLTVTIKK
jgi:hypothetical protein